MSSRASSAAGDNASALFLDSIEEEAAATVTVVVAVVASVRVGIVVMAGRKETMGRRGRLHIAI